MKSVLRLAKVDEKFYKFKEGNKNVGGNKQMLQLRKSSMDGGARR